MMVRSERFVSLMALLQENDKMTAKVLASRLGVSERTVYRDLGTLTNAGIPIRRRSGVGGGIYLPEDYRDSIQQVLQSALTIKQRTIGGNGNVGIAQLGNQGDVDILERFSPEIINEQRAIDPVIVPYVHVDKYGWFQYNNDLSCLPTIQQAVLTHYEVTISYKNQPFTIKPYGLVVKGNVWQVIAECDDIMQVFRAGKIKDAGITSTSFVRDPDFNLLTFWAGISDEEKIWARQYPAQIRVKQDVLHFFDIYFTDRYTKLDESANGRFATLSVIFNSVIEAKSTLLGLGTAVKVIMPSELHDMIVETANSIVDFHGQGSR